MIPPHAHLIWLGRRLPALAYLSVRSALAEGGFETVTLHHEDAALADDPLLGDLAGRPGFRTAALDVRAYAERDGASDGAGGLPPEVWDRLVALDGTLPLASSRSNLHRLELLWHHGGVYLDTDLVVLQSFAPLLAEEGFAGLERICFPSSLSASRNPLRWFHSATLTTLRAAVCRVAPVPSAAFERIERLYFLAANNAVLGARPRHPFVRRLLERAAAMDDAAAHRRFRLGPRLIQDLDADGPHPHFAVQPPRAFYPLAPEVCVQYVQDDPRGRLGAAPPGAYGAHLYDSVLKLRLGEPISTDYFRRSRGRTMLARMAEPYLDDLFRAAADASVPVRREPGPSGLVS